jgi:hypothetical protein
MSLLPLIALFASFSLTLRTPVTLPQTDSLPPAAPPNVQRQMPKGAVSLMYGTYPIGTDGSNLQIHVYGEPLPETIAGTKGASAAAKLTREDLTHRVDIPRCHFTVDILKEGANGPTPISHFSFNGADPVNQIQIKWLDTLAHKKPVIAIHAGVTHWMGWYLAAYPEGIEKPCVVQYFGYGGEQEESNLVKLDGSNSQGSMVVVDEWSSGEKSGVKRYVWNQTEFEDKSAPYFLILGSLKTSAEAYKELDKLSRIVDCPRVCPSSHYRPLKPGYFLVIGGQYAALQDARAETKRLNTLGIRAYVRRVY